MSKAYLIRAFLLLVTVVAFTSASGQTLTGRITNSDGNPVPFATVFVSELKHGTTANIKGEYQINLKPGNYTLYFQSLGYSPEVRTLESNGDHITIDVVLSMQYYEIPEVRVSSTGEDPAYYIMRRAIGLAPYYLNQIKKYTADVYIKGSMVIDKIPRLIKRNLDIDNTTIEEGKVYLIESVNEIEFTAPDRYSQRVVAQKSTFPEQGGGSDISPLDFIQASFYQPVLVDIAISPLAPNAMSHYNFRYEGSSPQGKYIINKIAVIPKRKSQQVFEGTIYIIEDYWCLHSLELTNNNLAGSITIKQLYAPVEEEIWMPVTHSFDVSLSIVGVRGGGEYSSAVTYRSVEPNDELERPGELPALYAVEDKAVKEVEAESKPLTREQEKIEEILNRDEISNRDMIRLSRLMQKEASREDTTSNQLEIKQTTTYTVDENAGKRDSAYWNSIRPIPLSEDELRSIKRVDSIASLRSSGRSRTYSETDSTTAKSGASFGKFLSASAFGKTFRSESGKVDFRFNGFVNPEYLTFNSVDGLRYGTGVRFSARGEKGVSFILTPTTEWAFARERLLWRVTSTLRYNNNQSLLTLSAGRRSDDFNSSAGIGNGMNMITSLFWKENHLKLYESNYLLIRHRNEIANGLYATLYYSYEDRKMLTNHSDFSIFRRDNEYMPNRPVNQYLPETDDPLAPYQLSNHLHHEASIEITYTPRQRYYMRNGVKSPAGSNYPTFSLKWEHGLNTLPGRGYKSYDLITGNISDDRSIGALSEYGWKAGAGGFLNREGITFPDFSHFNSQPVPVMFMNYRNLFMIPGYYTLATPEWYAEAHFRFTTPYLAIKMLPFLSNSLMRENLSLAWLYTPHRSSYTEIGYAMSEIFLIGKAGIYTGFRNLKWEGTVIRISLIIN